MCDRTFAQINWMSDVWLTAEERALPLVYDADVLYGKRIRCTADRTDLTGGPVTVDGRGRTAEELAAALFAFGLWWRMEVHRRLNGHGGLGCIEWRVLT